MLGREAILRKVGSLRSFQELLVDSPRCDKAGFICRGYAVPKAWIFEPKNSGKDESSHPPPPRHKSNPSSRTNPSSTTRTQEYHPLLPKIKINGNSDPFYSFAVPIGSTDNFYLKFYHLTVIPQLYTIQNRRWISSLASSERDRCFNSLGDEASAYSLLARIAAIHSVQSGATSTISFTRALAYQSQSHAALRKKLTSLDEKTANNEAVIYETMWATYLLAITDILLRAPSAKVHLTALRELYTRYVRVNGGPPVNGAKFLFPFYVDVQYACMTLSRPMFDILDCFPHLENLSYSRWHVPNLSSVSHDIHREIEDKQVRRMIIVKREGQYVHRELNEYRFEDNDLKHISFAIHSRNLWFQAVMLNIALDALDELKTSKLLGVKDYTSNTRAFIAVAVLHWGRFASSFPVVQ